MGSQWKDIVQIFHLVPIGCLSDHWFGHNKALKNRPTLEHAGNLSSYYVLYAQTHPLRTEHGTPF